MKDGYKKITAIVSILLTAISVVAYSFYDLGYYIFCSFNYKYFYIYSDAFGPGIETVSCENSIREISGNIAVTALFIAVSASFFLIFSDDKLRKIFLKFIKYFIPTGIAVYILGYISSFCLMWSCNDGITPALHFDVSLFLIAIFTIAWSVLFPYGRQKLACIFILIIPTLVFFGHSKLIETERRPVSASINAIESNNFDKCPTISEELRQSCLEQIAIGLRSKEVCQKIKNIQHQSFCESAVEEQVIIDKTDIMGCSKIGSDQDWIGRCNERMKDKRRPESP
jgi:hypothetical protein